MTATLVVNESIAAEDFGGEVVLIDIEKGLYFSLQGLAIDLWRSFAEPRRANDVLGQFAAQGADRDVLACTLDEFLRNELVAETSAVAVAAPEWRPGAAGMSAPVVSVFSDLAELIAIDPVHEVDAAAGWPHRPANVPDAS